MASVFLSYDHDDLKFAQPIAKALEKAGHQVWFDRHIHGGAQFSRQIEQQLDSADVVVVLWSANSLDSAWVRDEAAEGRDRGKLVPLSLGGATPPIGFRQFQTILLGDWGGRGKVPLLPDLLKAIDNQLHSTPAPPPKTAVAARPASRTRLDRRGLIFGSAVVALAIAGAGAWTWFRGSHLPVVEVAAADGSSRSQAAANDLFIKLGSLAQVGEGKWKLVDQASAPERPNFVFRTAGNDSSIKSSASLLLLNGKDHSLLWSREFNLPRGTSADVRQQLALTAGRVLGCALEGREAGGLPGDLQKIFLEACASLADVSGDDLGQVAGQLRGIVERQPRFEPAWRRLIIVDAASAQFARYTPAFAEASEQARVDVRGARSKFPNLPELAIADVALADRVNYGRNIDLLTAAAERAPDNPQLIAELGNALVGVGRMAEAINQARRAAELDPLSPSATAAYIMTLAYGGELEAARAELTKAEHLWAGTASIRDARIAFSMRYGDPEAAMAIDRRGYNSEIYYQTRLDPSPANIARLKAGIDEFRSKSVTPDQVGWAIQGLAQFGLVDDVYYWLGRLPDPDIARASYLFFRPVLASARSDPRFMPLMKRIGLLDYWRSSGYWPDYCRRPGIPYDCKAEAAKIR